MAMNRLAASALLLTALAACPSKNKSTRDAAPAGDAGSGTALVAVGPPIDKADICARTPAARAAAVPGAKPFSRRDPSCPEGDPFCDTVDKTPDPKDTCFVANDNIARAARESRASSAGQIASTEWDRKTPPKYLDRIDAHFHLTGEEHERLKKNGFVVLDRLAYTDYASAFHDVFQEQLPLFVGVDAIFHSVFRGTELALERIERKRLVPALPSMLRKLRQALAAAHTLDAETRGDLDLYLGVAAALASPTTSNGTAKLSAIAGGDEAAIAELLKMSSDGALVEVTLFGRSRMIDFSQLVPRGHYAFNGTAAVESLEAYFRAVMWLSRLEFNIVSRSSRSSAAGDPDPSETPREVKLALALAELVERSGATTEVRAFEEVYGAFAGKREDLPPAKLLEIARASGVGSPSARDATDKVKAAIGTSFRRTARTHFTPEGAPELPVITTLLGPRVVPDVAPLTRVVHDEIQDRKWLAAADLGFLLGHDRARAFIPDYGRFLRLPEAFMRGRDELRQNALASTDAYGSWLRAILALADPPAGTVPSFVKSEAYADHRLNSALVGYGQLRHAFVLLAAQGYDAYGCEIPDAYVEPLPTVFEALLTHVRGMRARAKGWEGLERVIGMLATIARAETSGRDLTEPQRRWLAMVSEHIPKGGYGDSGEPPKWTGWYFDMFEDREHGATGKTSFIADYFTLTNAGEVAYLGAEGPRLGVFLVDTNGEPRAMVGPVAKGFELHHPLALRLDDEASLARELSKAKQAAWRSSYAVAERPEPALGLEAEVVECTSDQGAATEWRIALRSVRPAGRTTVTLLDHHGDPLTSKLTLDVGSDWKVGVFDLPKSFASAPSSNAGVLGGSAQPASFGVEAIHLRVEDLARSGTGHGPFDRTTSPSVFETKDGSLPEGFPVRPRGAGGFSIGLPAASASSASR